MFRRKQPAAAPTSRTEPKPWPPVRDGAQLDRLDHLLDAFFASRAVGDAWEVARQLLEVMPQEPHARGSALHMPWEIWGWLAHVAEQVSAIGEPLLAAKLAVFVGDWHDRFVPNSDNAWMILSKAEEKQRRAIEEAACEACYQLEPTRIVRSPHDVSAGELHQQLSARLGRPIDLAGRTRVHQDAASSARVDKTLDEALSGDEAEQFLARISTQLVRRKVQASS